MPAESVQDRERERSDSEPLAAGLAAEIDRLWDDLVGEDRPGSDTDGGSGDAEKETPTAVIDAVVEPPAGASQSAVEAAVADAESGGRSHEVDEDEHLSM